MDFLEIDCESYATRIAYAATNELFGLLQAEEKPDVAASNFLGVFEEEELERVVQMMGAYVCNKGCDSGERLFRFINEKERMQESWQDAPAPLKLLLQTFVDVCAGIHTKLRCYQIQAEQKAQRPAAPGKVALEDTIFEPVGSLNELHPHAVEASRQSARLGKDPVSAPVAATAAPLSAGETVHSGEGNEPDTSLPSVPQTPSKRKASRRKPNKASDQVG